MKLTIVLAFTLLFTALYSFGQTEINDEKPFIEVNGTADLEIIPDEIYISIFIHERLDGKVKITITEQEENLKKALAEIGVDLSNLSLSDANADYIRVRWKTNEVITKKDYTLKVSDAKTLSLVFQELEKLEIRDAFVSRVDHSNIENLRKEVKIMAIKAAKNKADYLLEAIGEKTGKALVVRENIDYSNYQTNNIAFNYSLNKNFSGMNPMSDDIRSEIQFEMIKVQSSIYVKFSIE